MPRSSFHLRLLLVQLCFQDPKSVAGILSGPNLGYFQVGTVVTQLLNEQCLRFTLNGTAFTATATRFTRGSAHGMHQGMAMLGNTLFGCGTIPSIPLFVNTTGVDSEVSLSSCAA